jgi:hypothetical protein
VELRVEMGRKEQSNSKIVQNLIAHTKTLNGKLLELRGKEDQLEELARTVEDDEAARVRGEVKRRRVMLRGLAARMRKNTAAARFATWKALSVKRGHDAELGRVSKQFERLFEMRESEWRISERTRLHLQGVQEPGGAVASGGTQSQQQTAGAAGGAAGGAGAGATAGWESELENVLAGELSPGKSANAKASMQPEGGTDGRRPSQGWLW